MTVGQSGWLRSGHRVTIVALGYVLGVPTVTVRLGNGQTATITRAGLAVRLHTGRA